MGWDCKVDKNGRLEIIVSRWYNQPPPKGRGEKIVWLCAEGFEPHEPVQVEICGDQE